MLAAILIMAVTAVVPAVPAAYAQTNTGEIAGVVTDAQGAVVPGATVLAVHTSSGRRVERVSDDIGRFFLPELPIGE